MVDSPRYILGISCFYHDGGACLLRDGLIVAAAEEERFTRKKHDASFPSNAIDYCLTTAGITIEDVTHIGFYEKPFVKFTRILETCLAGWPFTWSTFVRAMPIWLKEKLRIGPVIQNELNTDADIIFCEHHLSHAASSFLVSPFDEALVLTMDGVGEWTTTAWGIGRGNSFEMKETIRFPHSIGLLFSAITAYLGFRVNDAEWKVMGLAPYGKPKYLEPFRKLIHLRDDGSFRLNMSYFNHHHSAQSMFTSKWEQLFGEGQRKPETELSQFHLDIAHSGQKLVEEVIVHLAGALQRRTGMTNLCLAGGVALNSVANWRIRDETGFENIFIQPAAGDSGGALGAAFYIENTILGGERRQVMKHALWGPEFTDDEIAAFVESEGIESTHLDEDEMLRQTAALIADGAVIGWFQGRMEFGPRALGARSILADPRREDTKERINRKVKFREWFRPFAPAVTREFASTCFDMPDDLELPFMLMVPDVREDWKEKLPAITHEDGTARVQTLTEEDNGRFYKLAAAFGELTGVPVVLNTSFNVRGEPIVTTPADAWRCFLETDIDALVMGNHIITAKTETADLDRGMARSIELEKDSLVRE